MKRIALFFAIAVAAISCAPEVIVTPEITVTTAEAELVLSPEEGMIPIAFSTNVDWKAEIKEPEAREWCAVSPSRGGKAGDNILNVICIANKGTANRTATVAIKAMELVHEVVITQLQTNVLVLTADKEYDVPYQGQEIRFKVSHNLDLEIDIEGDWIKKASTKALEEKDLTFVVEPNTGAARSGKIAFTAGPLHEEISINQDAWVLEFTVDPAEDFTFNPEGGTHKIIVSSNVDYDIDMESSDWLTMSKEADEYTFTAIQNNNLKAREVTVSISPKSAKYIESAKVIKISQKGAGAKLSISELEKRITFLAQQFEMNVDANIKYHVEYKKVVDGAYVDLEAEDKWLSHTESGDKYTFTALENASWEERSVMVCFIPEDAAYSDMTAIVPVYQYGYAFKMWSMRLTDIEGYDSAQKVRLALYKDKILLANTTKVYLLNPATGAVESTIPVPAGATAHSVLVDDAGNVMIAADGLVDQEIILYHIPDPMNPSPKPLLTHHTGNYYGSETGNFRVKGNILDDAVITAVVSDGQDGENIEDGAVLMWQVTDGVCGEWCWTNVPYTAWNVASICCYPAGNSIADGLFYIGYGGDYNLKYTSSVVKNPVKAEVAEGEANRYVESTSWSTSFVTGSSWMENYNCLSTAQWRGNKYAAILKGCHFNYDNADMAILNINDPTAATLVYEHTGEFDVERSNDWANLWWTGNGIFSDIVLIPTEEALLMVGADSNYGTLTCVALMK